MLDFQPPSFEGEEEEEIPSPYHVGSSSSSFIETYPHFPAWQYNVINLDGTYSSISLNRPEHTLNVPYPIQYVLAYSVFCPYFFLAY